MTDKKQLEEVYKQNLEDDIINIVSEIKGIDNMDAKYLAEDLIENEPELFR